MRQLLIRLWILLNMKVYLLADFYGSEYFMLSLILNLLSMDNLFILSVLLKR